jgi:hypothetical protein
MQRFHSDLPEGCPPPNAEPLPGTIYRCAETLDDRAFLSHREANKPCDASTDGAECHCWGTSVWVDPKDVREARKIYSHFRRKIVVIIRPQPNHGVIIHSPSRKQPGHWTMWRDITVDLLDFSTILSNDELD